MTEELGVLIMFIVAVAGLVGIFALFVKVMITITDRSKNDDK